MCSQTSIGGLVTRVVPLNDGINQAVGSPAHCLSQVSCDITKACFSIEVLSDGDKPMSSGGRHTARASSNVTQLVAAETNPARIGVHADRSTGSAEATDSMAQPSK